MRRILISAIILVVTAVILVSTWIRPTVASTSQSIQETSVPGEVLVKYRWGASPDSLAPAATSIGATFGAIFPELRWVQLKLPPSVDVAAATAVLSAAPAVELVQPNFVYSLNTIPNDERFDQLYGMLKISAPQAWDTTTGDPNVIVAVVDTGIDRNHPDLGANVWQNPGEVAGNGIDDDQNGYIDDTYGWDFLNGDNDPVDGHSHGTHCSGTIGGIGNNGIGVAGVNWNVKIMPLKTHDDIVGGSTSVTVMSTYSYITMMKRRGTNIRATSNSYGGPPEAGAYDAALRDAIDTAGRAGVLNVFAAGNQLTVSQENNNDVLPTYPSSYDSPSVLAVAASDKNDNKASFSHYGATTVDVAAPGVGIMSTVPGGYASLSGTSMSTPHTAGAAALIAAAHPHLSAASIKATLMNTVDVLPQWSGVILTGGRINVARAIASPTVCNYKLSLGATSFELQGGSGVVGVSSGQNCGFDAYADQPWVVVTSSPGFGNGSVEYQIAPNFGLEPRTATLVIAGRLLTIAQRGTAALLPTASVSGRILTPDGKGINKAVVRMTDSLGVTRQATSDAGGNYRFDNVGTGRTYGMSVEAKKYMFEDRTIIVLGNSDNVDFEGTRTK